MNWVNIGSSKGLAPVRRQAITWINDGLLSIGPLGKVSVKSERKYNIFIQEMCSKMLSARCQPFCSGFNVLVTTKWVCFITSVATVPIAVARERCLDTAAVIARELIISTSGIGWKYSALSIFRGHISLNISRRHHIARPWGRYMGCRPWMQSLVEVV